MVTSGDGFQARAEPGNPDIVYAQAQYGALVRFDRKTGEETYLAPMAEPGEPPLRWNWDSPLVVSPHSPTRLYFAAQRVYRSDEDVVYGVDQWGRTVVMRRPQRRVYDAQSYYAQPQYDRPQYDRSQYDRSYDSRPYYAPQPGYGTRSPYYAPRRGLFTEGW